MLYINNYIPDQLRITGTTEDNKTITEWDDSIFKVERYIQYSLDIPGRSAPKKRKRRKKRIGVIIRNPETGEIVDTFRSITQASEVTGLSDETVKIYARQKLTRKGYSWEFIEEERK